MRLKEIRNKTGLTQEEVSVKLGVNQNTISQWETGERMPRAEKLIQLAKLFNCTVDELLKD